MLMHAVDYGPAALWITHAGARCGLRMLAHAVDFPALRVRAHISAPDGAVEERYRVTPHPAAPLIGMRLRRAY